MNPDGTFRRIHEVPMQRCECGGESALWLQEGGVDICCYACAVRRGVVTPSMAPLSKSTFARATDRAMGTTTDYWLSVKDELLSMGETVKKHRDRQSAYYRAQTAEYEFHRNELEPSAKKIRRMLKPMIDKALGKDGKRFSVQIYVRYTTSGETMLPICTVAVGGGQFKFESTEFIDTPSGIKRLAAWCEVAGEAFRRIALKQAEFKAANEQATLVVSG